MALVSTLKGSTLKGRTLVLAAPPGGLEPAVLPIKAASGNVAVGLTGVLATAAVGALAAVLSLGLSGESGPGGVGTVTYASSSNVTVAATGVVGTGQVGTASVTLSIAQTGNSGAGAVGSVAPGISKAVSGNAGTGTAGNTTAGITRAATGSQATGAPGAISSGISVTPTSNSATGAAGAVSVAIVTALTGAQASGVVGSMAADVGGDISISIFGVAATGGLNGFPYGEYVPPVYGDPDYYEHMGVNFRDEILGVSSTGSVGTLAAVVYDDVVITLTAQQAIRFEAVLRLHGLIDPLVVSATARGDGTVTQTMTGAGPVTVTTTGLPAFGAPTAALVDSLSRWYGLIAPMIEQDASRSDGTLSQSVVTVGGVSTVTTL